MKKLISILLMLMVLCCGVALAEEAAPTATPVPAEETSVPAEETPAPEATPEPTAVTVEALQAEIDALKARLDKIDPVETATPTPEAKVLDGGELAQNGLIVTAGGLAGVFLVLILFFLTIKFMGKVLK